MANVRMCDSLTLMRAVLAARQAGLKKLPNDRMMSSLDPTAWHTLTVVTLDHRGEGLPPHHRVSALIRTKGNTAPTAVIVDVLSDHWLHMQKAADWRRKHGS